MLPLRRADGRDSAWSLPQKSRIIAIDPGKRTGIAVLEGEEFVSYEDDDYMRVCEYIFREVAFGWVDMIVCENFIMGGKPGAVTPQPYSLEIIGCVRWICTHYGVEFITQNPVERKTMNKEFLKKLGWYKGTKGDFEGHADDAAMHLGAYLMEQQDQKFLWRLYT